MWNIIIRHIRGARYVSNITQLIHKEFNRITPCKTFSYNVSQKRSIVFKMGNETPSRVVGYYVVRHVNSLVHGESTLTNTEANICMFRTLNSVFLYDLMIYH
uniref:Ovule protein n=1 Tax=Heterorhabditis bacteriophora TaxID=37862 RepID=A0A1I7WCU4_HETBA